MIAQLFKLFVLHYLVMGITTFTKVKKRLSRIGRKEVTELVIAHLKSIFKIDLNPVLGEEVKIPSIQSVLREGKTTNGKFFRKEPEWVDFDNGFVVERKEVDYIIDKLDEYNLQMVLGEPASGKSVILKNIGFKLADNYDVYIVELKKHAIDDVKEFFGEILKCDNRKVVFIVDDAHLCISECERLISNFRSSELKAKLIIGSRETEEIKGKNPKECSEFEKLSKTHIYPKEVTEKMIECFLRKKHDLGDERIKRVSRNLKKYKNDLWYLSWALMAYKTDKDSVDDVEIYDKIRDNIRDIRANKDEEPINAEDVFLALSVFYRFEIPVEKYFLVDELGIDEKIINQLVGLSEIVESENIGRSRMLSLNHSSIAKLYFKTYNAYPDLGRNVKKKIRDKNKDDLEYCLFYKYLMNTNPTNVIDVVIGLGWDWIDEKRGIWLIKKLVADDEIQKSIESGIKKEEDIGKIGYCIRDIGNVNKEQASKIIRNMNIDDLSVKIEKEKGILNIGYFLRNIAYANKEAASKIIRNIDVDDLSVKIEKEGNIEEIGRAVSNIARASEKTVLKLIGTVREKIEKEKNIIQMGRCVNYIAWTSEKAALKLIDTVREKIEKEKNIIYIGMCVSHIARANEKVALKLIDTVREKIEKGDDISNIGWCVSDIARANEKVALKLVDTVREKIEKEEDIGKIADCVFGIVRGRQEIAQELVDAVCEKIEKEEDVEKIMFCIELIENGSVKVALNIIRNMDIELFSEKIEKEEDVKKIGCCVECITHANKEIGLEVIRNMNIELLSEKIEKEEDVEKIDVCVSYIADTNKNAAVKIINGLKNPVLRKELIDHINR